MYSRYGGSPSRAVSTMSLSVRPSRRILSRSITRSQSFAGVNSHDKPYRNLSVFSTPACARKTPSRASRMFTLSAKSPPPKVPQPERLDEVYEALKRGLQAYLQVHQLELDSLSRQMRESKRNSRLGFLYELDKQVKVIERFMRRLEFHLSKIDELYEAYCMQRRLRDGANKMVKAYTASPGSREARESLSEANKGYKEYTENMCMLESELENQLGEFHIKMKGLAGFARLCAGDQYEIFMKYGRQRWKLKGRIEINGKQVWDSEDMVFLPLITEFLSIKVTELKSLANHVVVGNVSCETKDLFAALPQTVAVDINDLGTIKLSLEVTWNPFDKDDPGSSAASTVNKAPSVNKRFSTYNQSPPDTPSLREQAFYNMLRRQEEVENGTAWSNSSESSDDSSSPQLSLGLRHSHKTLVQPEVQAAAPAIEISFAPRESAASTPTRATGRGKEDEEEEEEELKVALATGEEDSGAQKQAVPNGHARYSRSLSHISEHSVDGAVAGERTAGESAEPSEVGSVASAVSVGDVVMEVPVSPKAGALPVSSEARQQSPPVPLPPVDYEILPEPLPGSGEGHPALSEKEVEEQKSRPEARDSPDHEAPQPESLDRASSDSGTGAEETAVTEEPCSPPCASVPRTEAEATQGDPPAVTPQPPALTKGTEDAPQTQAPQATVEEAEKPGAVVAALPENNEGQQPMDSELEEALNAVISSLDDYRGQFPELQVLEQELRLLEGALTGRSRSRSSSVSLTVETALGSFDFLNTSDLDDEVDEEEEDGEEKKNTTDSEKPGAHCRPAEESAGEDEGCEERCWGSPSGPMSTRCPTLDEALLVHLRNCSAQLLKLGTFGPLRCGEMYALDRLLREARVLELIRQLTEDSPSRITQPNKVVPQLEQCQGALSLWRLCTDGADVYNVSTEVFLRALGTAYASQLPEHGATLADTVFLSLAERILERRLPRRGGGAGREALTIFQFWSYLEAEGVIALDTHITELAEEVWLVQSLQSGDQDTLLKTLKRPPESSLKREGLRAISLLLTDPRAKVCAAASSLLRSLADQPRHRERALVSCLELLEDGSVGTRVSGCKALACLKAKESIEQLVYLCRTDKEDVRDAAKQALLALGEEGKLAYRHVEEVKDGVPRLFAPGSMASTAF
ncbi:rho family-interacting cell polarization regulator 1 isoform X1 [Anguilla anguilla]|uniref:rho family-interacting cell polarization regulator 1 isoform X1 n=2 Tax=Anguilla anguilla TaxID=7936 RepID=UPI0015AB3473|nr:rho family-interacting cell polarization regulator 1 isoform X1 [Anguilla anguilla]